MVKLVHFDSYQKLNNRWQLSVYRWGGCATISHRYTQMPWMKLKACGGFNPQSLIVAMLLFVCPKNIHITQISKSVITHTHPFNSPLSGTTQVSRYQKSKTNLDLLEQEIVSGSGISWAICKSAPLPRHITMPASHRSVFHRPDALPAAKWTASKHWRQKQVSNYTHTQPF